MADRNKPALDLEGIQAGRENLKSVKDQKLAPATAPEESELSQIITDKMNKRRGAVAPDQAEDSGIDSDVEEDKAADQAFDIEPQAQQKPPIAPKPLNLQRQETLTKAATIQTQQVDASESPEIKNTIDPFSTDKLSPNNPFNPQNLARNEETERAFDDFAKEQANIVDDPAVSQQEAYPENLNPFKESDKTPEVSQQEAYPENLNPFKESDKTPEVSQQELDEIGQGVYPEVANEQARQNLDQDTKGVDAILALIEKAPKAPTGELSEKDTYLKINDLNNQQIQDAKDKGVTDDALKHLQDLANKMQDSITALATTEKPQTIQDQTQNIIGNINSLKEAYTEQKNTNQELKSALGEKDPEQKKQKFTKIGEKLDKASPMQKAGIALATAALAPIAAVGLAIAGLAFGVAKGTKALASGAKNLLEKAAGNISDLAEKAAEKVDNAVDVLKDNAKTAGKSVKDSTKDNASAIKDAVQKAGKSVKDFTKDNASAVKDAVQKASAKVKTSAQLTANSIATSMVKHDGVGGPLSRLVKAENQKGLEAQKGKLDHKIAKSTQDLQQSGITDEQIKDISDLAKNDHPKDLKHAIKEASTNAQGIKNTSLQNKLTDFAKDVKEFKQVTEKLQTACNKISSLQRQRQETKDNGPLDGKSLKNLFKEENSSLGKAAASLGSDLNSSGVSENTKPGTKGKSGSFAQDVAAQQQQSAGGKGPAR